MNKKLFVFRRIAILEGWSFIILLLAMPLKYFAGFPMAVKVTGWLHGFLFILYCIWILLAGIESRWNLKGFAIAFAAAWIPGGTFWLDRKIGANPESWGTGNS
jgi:integral membrane protein